MKKVSHLSNDSNIPLASSEKTEELRHSLASNPNDYNRIEEAKNYFYFVLLGKVKSLKLCCCGRFAEIKFNKDSQKVNKFERLWKAFIVMFFAVEVAFTLIDLIVS